MTGFGEAHCQRDGLTVSVEVRTINSRYFKISTRVPEGYASLEAQIESLLRDAIRRGTIQVNVRIDRARPPEEYRIHREVLDSYRQQLNAMAKEWGVEQPVSLDHLLSLPGVVDEDDLAQRNAADDWPLIEQALRQAMEGMNRMRAEEGRAMAADLANNCGEVSKVLEQIAMRAPLVVDGYRARLEERLKKALAEFEVTLEPSDLIREVSLFTDRSDISEEIVRLRSHLGQFAATLESSEGAGRKLEFLTQEMFRETNTIGSKANDIEIAHAVVGIKAAIERIREMIQNIE
jgi:uncharacterized protein (TIGR00255 family)